MNPVEWLLYIATYERLKRSGPITWEVWRAGCDLLYEGTNP